MDSVIHIDNVYKSYGNVEALHRITFDVGEQELFGIIGPDGAGKTSLFRIIATLLKPDSGLATVLGLDSVRDYKQIRPLLGYMPGRFSLYLDLTVEENLHFFATVFGTTLQENYEMIAPIYHQLEPFNNRLAGNLSGGMKQKLALSCALIHKPKLLLLDEPTTGVDAVSRKEFWEMLHLLKKEGITIVVSTPYMDEAGQCDRIALIQDGKILKIDNPSDIVTSFDRPLIGIKSKNRYKLLKTLNRYSDAYSVHPFGEYVHYTDQNISPDMEELKAFLIQNGVDDAMIKSLEPDIEDVFMALMDEGEKN